MPRPKVVQKEYAHDFNYIVSYYLETMDFCSYRSKEKSKYNDWHYTVVFEENGIKVSDLCCNRQVEDMSAAMSLFLRKRHMFHLTFEVFPELDKTKNWTVRPGIDCLVANIMVKV